MKRLLFLLSVVITSVNTGFSQTCPTSDYYPNGQNDGNFNYSAMGCKVLAVSGTEALINAPIVKGCDPGRNITANFYFGVVCSTNWNDINVNYQSFPGISPSFFPPSNLQSVDTLFTGINLNCIYVYPNFPNPNGYNFTLKNLTPGKTYYAMPYVVYYNPKRTSYYLLYLFTPTCFITTNPPLSSALGTPSAAVTGVDTTGVTIGGTFPIVKDYIAGSSVLYSGLYWSRDSTKLDTLTPLANKNYLYFASQTEILDTSDKTYSVDLTGLQSNTKYYYRPVFSMVTPNSKGKPTVQNFFGKKKSFTTPFFSPQTWFNEWAKMPVGADQRVDTVSAVLKARFDSSKPGVKMDSSLFIGGMYWSRDSNELKVLDPLASRHFVQGFQKKKPTLLDTVCMFNLRGLSPATTYYYVPAISWINSKKMPGTIPMLTRAGKIGSFTTDTLIPISNNTINTGNIVLCINGDRFIDTMIIASQPSGGNSSYEYKWIVSSDSGKTWTKVQRLISLNKLGLNGAGINTGTLMQKLFRRIITSGNLKDTSNSVSVYYAPAGYNFNPHAVISPTPDTKPGALALKAELIKPLAAYNVQWYFNPLSFGTGEFTPKGTQNTYIIRDTSQTVKATISYGRNCPAFATQVIGSSNYDANNNIYPTVLIGAQIWMASNLRATAFSVPGQSPVNINFATTAQQFNQASVPYYCWFPGDATRGLYAGALYNSYVINTTSNVCPTGWHVATSSDWETLFDFVSGPDGHNAAPLLMNNKWEVPNFAGDLYNFSAVSTGQLSAGGQVKGQGTFTSWWSGPGTNGQNVVGYYYMTNVNSRLYFVPLVGGDGAKITGNPVRCILNTVKEN